MNYTKLTLSDLKTICKNNKYKNYSSLRKSELITFIKKNMKKGGKISESFKDLSLIKHGTLGILDKRQLIAKLKNNKNINNKIELNLSNFF